nr:GGDEF domain-containing protein [Acidaminobacter sp. JC074]
MAVVVSACYLHRYVRKEDKAKKELFEHSVIDEVTGAYNRRYYSIKLGEVFDESLRYDRRFSLVLLDIDKFKNINDSHGHSFGDTVLKEFSDEAKKVIRPSDTFCRMGGDEFLIILPNHELKLQEALSDRINSVTQVMNERFSSKLNGEFSVSVGLSVYPDDADNLEEIYRCADMAMYEAKMYNESKMIPYCDLQELHEMSVSR